MRCRALLLSCTLALACADPPVVSTRSTGQDSRAGHIAGNVVAQGRSRGNAVLFLFDAARPPPPEGTGRPLSFAVVGASELYGHALGDSTATGPFAAPFSFSLVPPGHYLVRGFIDRDSCGTPPDCRPSDFIPWYSVTSEPNAGDVRGAAVDLVTRLSRVIDVEQFEDGSILPARDVPVSFSDAQAFAYDRPSFSVATSNTFNPTGGAKTFTLVSMPVKQGVVDQAQGGLVIRLADRNNDGQPDRRPDTTYDFYPRVIVRKLAEGGPPLLDENDLDRDGVVDAAGPDYLRADDTLDGKPDAVVLDAGIDPNDVYPVLVPGGTPTLNPATVAQLRLVVRPLALDVSDPAAPVPLKAVPPGRYAIVVISDSGQTWRVPNELQPSVASAYGLPSIASQAYFINVP